ncbi:transmembrane protein 272-like [Physella acuta]|uniref:transmembrane protein 272-like n=1 Tax=Physella acuta TaxID=109671 RepID=UPI0027DCC36E|nr:transmembrane protein 272-like [Physella acuta]
MFVRKGTTLRKKHQSIRRPRRPSLQHDPEVGETSPVNVPTQPPAPSNASSASSTLTLNEEKTLVHHSTVFLTNENYQHVNYGSILFQLKEAHGESTNLYDFIQRIWEIIWQSLVLTVFLLLLFGLPISMLAMGTSYLEECPKEPKIPIYLLVGGAFGFIFICIVLWQQKRARDYMLLDDSKDDADVDDDDVMTRSYRFTGYILSLFLLIWFALGNYWLFGIWQPNYTQPLHEPRNWCSKQLYTYAFYQLVTCYSLFGVSVIGFLGCLVAYTCGRMRK